MTIASREFRNAMSRFPTGVAVVTTESGGMRIGITVNSLVSVSLEPPLLSFCFGRSLQSYSAFKAAGRFAVNVLRRDQRHLSQRFSGNGPDKWKDLVPEHGLTGVPIFNDCVVVFECEHHETFIGGDHDIILGRVLHIHVSGEEKPLVYFRSAYHVLGSPEAGTN